jgi:XTP/dITP diphosphohydrolase
MTIWFATGNTHKRDELAAILRDHTIKIPSEAGLVFEPDETGATFLDNALIKARALFHLVHAPVIADDSGLCVDALGGRPGVYSARYGGEDGAKLTSAERNFLLLKEVGDSPNRAAHFVCAMALMLNEDRFFTAQETFEGELALEARGTGGFGYDPILYLPRLSRTVAELPDIEKTLFGHRGKAGRIIDAILERLKFDMV